MNNENNISIANDLIKKEQKYWKLKIDKDFIKTALPYKGKKCKKDITEKKYYINNDISNNILKKCNDSNENIFAYMYSVAILLLFKYDNYKKIAIETNILKQDNLLNIINSRIPLIQEVNEELTFKDVLIQARISISEAYENANYPIDKIYDMLLSENDEIESPLTDMVLVSKELHQEFDNEELYNKIKITISRDKNLICLNIKFDKDLYSEYYMDELVKHFNNILININNDINVRLIDIDVLDEDTKNKLLVEFNNTKTQYLKGNTIVELFEEQVEKTPNNIAVIFDDKELTYRELNERGNSVARELVKKGVKCKDRVGLIVDKSIEMIVGIIAILKSGASYVPIDYKYTEERINFMVDDSNVKVILGEDKFINNIDAKLKIININSDDIYMNEKTNLNIKFESNNIAYVIYTSGSTGKPKGTLIKQNSVIRVVKNTNYIEITSDDSILQLSSYVFDGSVFDIYGSLLNGAKLIIPNKDDVLNLEKLSCLIKEKVSMFFITTALFNSLVDINIDCLKNIRKVLFGGERASIKHVRKALKFLGKDKIIHVYGPTESTVFATYYPVNEINEDDVTIPIGKAISNTELYVLGKNKNISPIGIPGELYIGGDGLALGYLNNESLTKESFIDNPYLLEEKIYKTGDLVKMLPSGDLEFIDRIDKQVKIHGFRIELAEIETKLLDIQNIKNVVVIDKEKEDNKYLCAYYVSDNEYTVGELREKLKKSLPVYMIPSYFIKVDKIPLTLNGKVDKKFLLAQEEKIQTGIEYEAPRDEIEKILVKVWADTLNSKRIGINDDFFSLGGDSIKAIQLISRTKAKGYSFEVKNLYENTTIKKLSKCVKKNKLSIDQEVILGEIDLTPIQQWFFGQNFDEEYHFNQSMMLFKEDEFNIDILKKVFNKLIIHHDSLRMKYKKDNETIIQKNRGIEEKLYDLYLYENLQEEEITKKCNEIQSNINLEEGPLVKLALFKGSTGDHLLIVVHHLVIDGVSWRILIEDLGCLYKKIEKYGQGKLQEKTTSFKEWSQKQLEYAGSYKIEKEVEYWNDIGKQKIEKLPKNKIQNATKFKNIFTDSFELSIEETEKLLKKSNRAYNTEINDLLLTALALTISNWTGNKNTLINLEGHGREEIIKDVDISRTIGWFTSQYPVILKSYETVSDTLKNTKDMLRKIPNKGIGYGIIKYLSNESINYNINPEISFNYLGQIDSDEKNNLFKTSYINCGNDISENNKCMYSLDFGGIVEKNKLVISIKYNKAEFNYEKIQNLAENYKKNIINIINQCVAKEIPEKTVSDITKEEITLQQLKLYKDDMNNIKNIYNLSPMQEGMLYHTLTEGNSSYNVIMNLEVEGYIDLEALEKAFNEVIERHDILRTKFDYSKFNKNMQVVYKHRKTRVEYIDISNEKRNKEEYINNLINQYKEIKFDLSKDTLIKLFLVRMEFNRYTFILNTHHILMDGWCISLIVSELFKIYSEIQNEVKADLNDVVPYSNYIEWLKNKDIRKAEKYWKEYLEEYNEVIKIPFEKENKSNKVTNKKLSLSLDEEKTELINNIAKKNKVTVNTIIQSIWAILLQRYNNTNDIVYGYTVSGRNPEIEGIENIIGLFINTIPLRVRFTDNMLYKDLLINMNNTTLENSKYDYLGLAEIQNLSEVKNELINNILVFENYPIDEKAMTERNNFKILKIGGIDESSYNFNIAASQNKEILVDFKYNEEVYSTENIIKIKSHFYNIVKEIVKSTDIKVKDIEILEQEEKHALLVESNDTVSDYPRTKTISLLFEEQVEKTPNNVAVIFEDKELTYRELNERANSVARELVKEGVELKDKVGLIVDKSIEMIVGIIAILKSGASYVPIDYKYTEERINFMVDDANVKVILGDDKFINNIDAKLKIININSDDIYMNEKTNLNIKFESNNIAYVIYTSGSTGKPKGTLIKQNSVIRVVKNTNYIEITSDDSILQLSSYVFDGSVFDIYGSLLNGAKLIIPNKEDVLNLEKLSCLIKEKVSMFFITTALFNSLVDINIDCLKNIRKVLFGGERASIKHVRKALKFLGKDKIIHVYGPTESTVFATYYPVNEINEDDVTIPIGKAISNTELYVLGKNKNINPIGIPGELYIGGDGLALGYLNNESLTNESFIDNPYSLEQKIYRTGDLVKMLPSGDFEFIDRIDQQVKIRGFRIELGEIETKLLEIEEIKEIAVIDKEKLGSKYLCAYYVSQKEFTVGELRERLKKLLPDYMIPSYFKMLDKIPLTTNGKVDRKSLPEPDGEINIGTEYVIPENEIEEQMVKKCKQVLGLQRIGVRDNLFEIGANSITAMKICNEFKKDNINISIKDIFYYQNVRDIYKNCIYKEEVAIYEECEDNNEITHLNISEIKQNLIEQINRFNKTILRQNIIKTYYSSAVQQISKDVNTTFSGCVMDFDYKVNIRLLKKSIVSVINTQSLLRSIMVNSENKIKIQEYEKVTGINIPYLDLEKVNERKRENIIEYIINEIYGENLKNEQSVFNKILYKIIIIKLSDEKYKIYMPFNHLIFDGMSNEIIKSNIIRAYSNNGILKQDNTLEYCEYVKQLVEGPKEVTEKKIMEKFNLDNFRESFKEYFHKFSNTKLINTTISIELSKDTKEFIKEMQWDLSLKLFIKILNLNFDLDNIPFILINPGRSYAGKNYYNTIGEFIDVLPLSLKKDELISIDYVENLLSFVQDKSINFTTLLINNELKVKYKNISNTFKDMYTDISSIPTFNYIDLYDVELEMNELAEVINIDKKNKMSSEINIRFQQSKLIIDFFCEEQREFEIKEELKNYIYTLKEI